MIDPDLRIGPWSGRVWGLILNFMANAAAVYGAIGFVRDGSRLPLLVIGGAVTIACLLWLAQPAKAPDDGEETTHDDGQQ